MAKRAIFQYCELPFPTRALVHLVPTELTPDLHFKVGDRIGIIPHFRGISVFNHKDDYDDGW